MGENICKHGSDKGLISKIHTEFNDNKKTWSIKELMRHFSEDEIEMINTKNVQYH